MGWEAAKHIKEILLCEINEEGASKKEDRYRFLAEHSSDVLYELDANLYFTYISPSAEELFGYSVDDFKDYNLFEAIDNVVYSRDIGPIKEQVRKRLNGDCETEIDDFRINTYSGQLKWVQVKAKYIPDNNGGLQKIIGNIRDITSRKKLEEKVYKNAAIFDLLENHSKIAIVKVDAQLHAEYVSPSMIEVLGYPPGYFIGTSVMEVVHSEDRDRLENEIASTIEKRCHFLETEYRVNTWKGTVLWVETKARLFYDDRGNFDGAVYIQSDITDRKQQEQQLKAALHEKDFLMKELNHRVKNNLTMVSSLINLKDFSLGDQVDLSDVAGQIDAIRIVHEKLIHSENIAHIGLREYIQELLSTVFSFSEKQVKIEENIEDISIRTKTAIPIGLIINEIATNAVKHAFSAEDDAAFSIELTEDKSVNQYSLRISITGKPFPKDIDLDNPNTLGLQLITSLVEQLQGTIGVQREPHPVFTIRFPIYALAC